MKATLTLLLEGDKSIAVSQDVVPVSLRRAIHDASEVRCHKQLLLRPNA